MSTLVTALLSDHARVGLSNMTIGDRWASAIVTHDGSATAVTVS